MLLEISVALLLLQAGPTPAENDVSEKLKRADAMQTEGRLFEAEALYREVLLVQESRLGTDRLELVASLAGLGEVLHRMGRDFDSLIVTRRTLSIQERHLPPDDVAIGITLNNMAEVYRSRGNYTAADPLYRRSLKILETALGKRHAWVARVLNNFGALKVGTEHYDEASALLRRALALSEGHLSESAEVASILHNLAVCALERRNLREAERYLLRAMRFQSSVLAPDNPAAVAALKLYALVLRETGRKTQAERIDARISALTP